MKPVQTKIRRKMFLVIAVLVIHALTPSCGPGDKNSTGPTGTTAAGNRWATVTPDQIPEEQQDEYIAAKIKEFKKLPDKRRAEEIWALWKRIRFGEDQWYDWACPQDRLFEELVNTGDAGMALLLEQLQGDPHHQVYEASLYLRDFGVDAMHEVLKILEKGTEFQKYAALWALGCSFTFYDLPAEEELRMRKAVEAVLDHESSDIREEAKGILRALDWRKLHGGSRSQAPES